MEIRLLRTVLLAVTILTLNSCTSDTLTGSSAAGKNELVVNYTYSDSELETMKLINDYRISVGLNPLERINHISYKSEEHDNYMIIAKVASHDGFVARSENIMNVLGAKKVGENVAYNFTSSKGVVDAWLNSPGHKENIVGDFTHFGISIREDPATGKKYYTNIFAKI